MIYRRKTMKSIASAILLCFTSLTGAQPLYAIPANTQLPTEPQIMVGNGTVEITTPEGSANMTIDQKNLITSVIQWGDFSIGADATVNFKGPDNFNSLNYVTNGPVSEIYGQLTALGGNIFIANPAGVQIGNSAQINVGSLYVTNKDIGEAITNGKLKIDDTTDIASEIKGLSVADTNAELMSLGAIVNAKSVTFDGGRIVLDTERIYAEQDGEMQKVENPSEILNIRTTDTNNVVLGYDAYQEGEGYSNAETKQFSVTNKEGNTETVDGYMWVHDLAELQAMDTDTDSNYALRNSIDANATAEATNRFKPIGIFSGNFDGLGYSIFGLHIDTTNSPDDYAGLFSSTDNANIRNFTLNGGSINGTNNVGAAVGSASGGTIENITSTATVSGQGNIGGIVGNAEKVEMSGLINIGAVNGKVDSSNIGGVVGQMYGGSLSGQTYNLGHVSGGHNVGGIVGNATDNAAIGNAITEDTDTFQIYNQLNVTGGYNVGGIVGSISGGSVTNAANYGDVTANGLTKDDYSYHTAAVINDLDGATLNDGLATIEVNVSNVGGIAGNTSAATISNVLNDGDIKTAAGGDDGHYIAGNVGGIAGRAEDTTITNAENKENTVAGAHNVGGIAGYLGGQSTVEVGVNNGGDITATGARKYNENDTAGYAKERVRPYSQDENELFNVGNIGGIVGYLFGDAAQVKNSGNRGTVHSAEITGDTVPETAKAANVGGVVGKIDSGQQTQMVDVQTSENGVYINATVANSYSTGDVQGYTGVGGVVGMMHNGSIAGSYNLGTVQSTRAVEGNSRDPLNMGGVVGDTTEDSKASAVLYDVYNAGQIGDEEFTFYGRHVGGVVGRLSGDLAKAYNTGEIYNGYSTVGGIVGWWAAGDIKNVFNTGNITVVNNDKENGVSQVGGIAGAHSGAESTLSYAYNLGTIRSFSPYGNQNNTNTPLRNAIGGIIGYVRTYRGEDIGNNNKDSKLKIYNVYTTNNLFAAKDNGGNATYTPTNEGLGAIYGRTDYAQFSIDNSYYVKMYESGFSDQINLTGVIDTVTKDTNGNYSGFNSFTFNNQQENDVDNSVDGWRIYDGTTPILNAFLPDAEGYFSALTAGQLSELGIAGGGIQYGTAANPLLTIIDAKDSSNVTLDWEQLTSSGNASFAVYGGGLTLNHFGTDVGYYRGTLYADGELAINGAVDEAFQLGSSAKLYGTNVEIDANGDAVIYGNVTSTNGGLFINGDDIEIIGKLESSVQDGEKSVKNIAKKMADDLTGFFTKLSNPKEAVSTVSDAYARTTGKAKTDGAITVTASGNADILYGNLATGSVVSGSAFSVTSENGSVYVDSDLGGVKGGISLTADGEALFDISNIAAAGEAQDDQYGAKRLIEFLANHKQDSGNGIKLTSKNDDAILAVDMWEEDSFTLDKFNITGTTFSDAIKGLGDDLAGKTHIWISDADQLKGIQLYKDMHEESGILGYNFALKGNIDATELTDYDAIGGDAGYSGTFDGRDFRIIGLNSDAQDNNSASEGIFSKLSGTVKDLRVYASKFFGNTEGNGNVGAIAAVTDKNAEITGVTTFGNHVEAGAGGNAGGIAGTNAGTITDSAASDSVIANNGAAGGVAGSNAGTIGEAQSGEEDSFITSESAVTSATNADTTNTALGGIVGVNEESGNVYLANSLGVTNGRTAVDNVGGIAGQNHGTMSSLYNESIVTGNGSVGGVAGTNSGKIENAVNTTAITAAGSNAGGIAGTNSGKIDSGRNSGAINGNQNVGGMVGENKLSGILKDLSNALVAAITGKQYVGGVAGSNAGMITSDNNLVNEGTVSGTMYVGGIAGINSGTGTIENVLSDTLVLKTGDDNAQYFGGIAGTNSGIITNATNDSNVKAEGATYVGGIAGQNTESGWLTGKLTNNGEVTGKDKVGGLAGSNENDGLLIGKENGRLTVTNTGTVLATEGSAGGIFYENTGAIKYADLTNSGVVQGTDQENTGGLFGKNSGKITNSTLTNSGEVTGGGNTGGLIGYNTGDVSNSSLVNEYGAKVEGTGNNVGGLIGYNTGKIEGGRTNADGTDAGYYKYKVYNNGVVTGANNVGGLIGYNAADGPLTAAYNTGVVTATGNNAGGIVGNNAGTVSTVFNTIMTAIENGETQYGAVSGATNVGGIVGSNTGELTNAYNTTGVSGTTNIGNIVGENTGTVRYVYATNDSGTLIGDGSAEDSYSFSDEENPKEGITVIEEAADRNKQESYEAFAFADTDDAKAVWKIYEGKNGQSTDGTPLLKVFLTKAEYAGKTNFTYNGGNQELSLDDVTVDGEKLSNVAKTLLSALSGKNAYDGYLGFTSKQIAATSEGGSFNPNNLGYDIDASYKINKAQLDVALDEIYRTYGNDTMYGDAAQNNKLPDYSNSFSYTAAAGTTLNETMKNELTGKINITQITDEAVDGLEEGRTTNNVGDHDWSATVGLVGEDILNNYQLNADGASTISVTGEGKSHVSKADLTITLSDVFRIYGDTKFENGTNYGLADGSVKLGANGDRVEFNSEGVTFDDGGLTDDRSKTQKANVSGQTAGYLGDERYSWNVAESDYGKVFGINPDNYNLTVNSGESKVAQRELSVSDLLASIVYGDKDGNGLQLEAGATLSGLADGYDDNVDLVTDGVTLTATGAYEENRNKEGKNRATADVNVTDVNGVYQDSLVASGLKLGGDSVNNYYIANGTATGGIKVTPAPLTITLKDVEHTYGTVLDADAIGYGIKSTDGLVNGDDGAGLTFNAETAKNKDEAIYYHEDGGEWRTHDANGDYSYLEDIEDAFKAGVSRANYYANNGGAVNLDNYDVEYKGGKSVVKPKELGISDILATIIYGNLGGAGFKVSEGGNLTGVVYDDDVSFSQELKIEDAKFATDGSYEINRNGRTTADAGDNYAQKLTFNNLQLFGRHAGNYTVNGNVDAAIAVTRAQLSVTAHDKLTQLGREPEYTGTTYDELNGSLVNGDDLSGFMHAFGIEDAEMLNNAGHYPGKIGAVVDGLYYYDGTHDWSGHHGVFANYDVNVATGSLHVFVPVPDSSFNYGWLYDDAPYSRKWNFRERKAEIYFQDGGMEYDKNM